MAASALLPASDQKYAIVPYLNDGKMAVAQDQEMNDRPVLSDDQFVSFINALVTHFKCEYFKNLHPAAFSVKIKAPKPGERYFMNWDKPGHFGPITVFFGPHIVYTADMPPHGNLKQFLNTDRATGKFGKVAPEKLQDAQMSIGLSAAPYGDQEMDHLGRGVPQGQAQDWVEQIEAIAKNAWQTRHPEFKKRVDAAREKYVQGKCKKCNDPVLKSRNESCNDHDALTPDQEKAWKEEILPGDITSWWAPVVRPTTRGRAIFCQSDIWTPMDERQKKSRAGVIIDPELLNEPDHLEAYKAWYYMKEPIRAFDAEGKRLSYKEAILLSPGDLIIPRVKIYCDFKYGNDMGKFRLTISCRSWQVLQRGVKTAVPEPTEGFNFTAAVPGLRLEPVDPKVVEERTKQIEKAIKFIAKHDTAEKTHDEWLAKNKGAQIPEDKEYKRLPAPVIVMRPPAIAHVPQLALAAPPLSKEKTAPPVADPKIAEENKRKRLADAAAAKDALLKKQQQQQVSVNGKRSSSDAPAAVATAAAATVPAAGPPVDTRASKRQKVTEEPSSTPPESDGDQEIG